MISTEQALAVIPDGLRNPLIEEYSNIVRNYMEHKWMPSEISGGRFCEVVYTIINGFSDGTYASTPVKPKNFIASCRTLESKTSNPRSFQILIPRMLTALYEIRNNRGVGHLGGDVDSNQMDSTVVLNMTSWIIAELIRVFHNLPIEDAQKLTDSLVEIKTPLIWTSGDIRRVLKPELSLKNQMLVLLTSTTNPVLTKDLLLWTECKKNYYLFRVLREMHSQRLVELSIDESKVELTPLGIKAANQIIAEATP